MAGLAPSGGVHFTTNNKWRDCCAVTGNAVGGFWSQGDICCNSCCMTVAMGVEIGGMALSATAAGTTINGGITITVNPNSAAAVCGIMAGGA